MVIYDQFVTYVYQIYKYLQKDNYSKTSGHDEQEKGNLASCRFTYNTYNQLQTYHFEVMDFIQTTIDFFQTLERFDHSGF